MLYSSSDKRVKPTLSISIPTLSNRCVPDTSVYSPLKRSNSFYNYCKANNILTSPKVQPLVSDFDFNTDSASIKFVNGVATRVRLESEEEIRINSKGEPSSSYTESIDSRLEQMILTLKSTCIPHSEPMKTDTPIDRYYMKKDI